ncbi:inner membrane-spanning protein YciB [Croceibacterium sp. TMG7-5b_MA50]|uniref:inner membrane-spanning protein YciB n=1 Tax=Croceibacterium sp. TMG7-5b_MA50 TaxID=3121290 RepID=UPI0032221DC3
MADTKAKSGWINVLVDYGPLLVFFLAYRHFRPDGQDAAGEILAVVKSTAAFIAASLVALGVSKWRLGRISPMLALSTALIVGFGALTIWFQDQRFIQWKPTIIYLGFGIALLWGWRRGRPLLKVLLEAAFDGLTDEGWLKLSRNWGGFFLVLAALNTALTYTLSFEAWLAAKLWLFMPLSFLFTFTQLPMLLRHGLSAEAEGEVVGKTPE